MRRRRAYEFKPDRQSGSFLKKLYMTRLQRLSLLKWSCYALLCVLVLVVQDVIFSRGRLFGATTDLTVAVILLISLYEGTENGSLFAIIASTLYWFSGSAPEATVILFITVLAVGINLFRQMYWRRSFGSTALCTGLGILLYELILFASGILTGRTILVRLPVFLVTAGFSILGMLLLYLPVRAIAKIGGDTWKE